MEIKSTEDLRRLKSEMDGSTRCKLSPEHDGHDEPDLDSTAEKAVLHPHEDPLDPALDINQHLNEDRETCFENQKSEEGNLNPHEDTISDDAPSKIITAQLNSQLLEEMKTNVAESLQDSVSNKDSDTLDCSELIPELKDQFFVSLTVKNDSVSPLHGGGGSLALLKQYRDQDSDVSNSDSDASSSTSSSSSSSSSGPTVLVIDEDTDEGGTAPGTKSAPVKTQDEFLIEDLPAVENLIINLPEEAAIDAIGKISSIIDQLVIIESNKNSPPLNEDSVLFNKEKISIGKVFEVFGPVCQPYYILRFNSQEDIDKRNLKLSDPVFFAPMMKDFTDYIFVEKIKQAKGSDASWKNDNEPPPEALDFSDDEAERLAKKKPKPQTRIQQQNNEESHSATELSGFRPLQKRPRRKPRQNWNSCGRPEYHNFQSDFHANYYTNPHFQQDYMLPPPCPFPPSFQEQACPPYAAMPPPPYMGAGPWNPSPYPGPMYYPPPPPPPPPPSSN